MRRKKGQSILEYVIVLTAIVVAVGIGVATFAGGRDKANPQGIGKLMSETNKTIINSTGKIADATK